MTLLLVTGSWFFVNLGLTVLIKPTLFHHVEFWLLQVCRRALRIWLFDAPDVCQWPLMVTARGRDRHLFVLRRRCQRTPFQEQSSKCLGTLNLR